MTTSGTDEPFEAPQAPGWKILLDAIRGAKANQQFDELYRQIKARTAEIIPAEHQETICLELIDVAIAKCLQNGSVLVDNDLTSFLVAQLGRKHLDELLARVDTKWGIVDCKDPDCPCSLKFHIEITDKELYDKIMRRGLYLRQDKLGLSFGDRLRLGFFDADPRI